MAERRDLRDLIKPGSEETDEINSLWKALLDGRAPSEVSDVSDLEPLPGVGTMQLTWTNGEPRALPPSVRQALLAVLRALALGDGVAVVPEDNELTTGEAAQLLGVSRNYLVRLIEQGELPCRWGGRGTHRRLRVEDVVAYRRVQQSKRREAIRRHDAASERFDLP
jgi:excisionase family DNA binding protein